MCIISHIENHRKLNNDHARVYVRFLEADGYKDWRLPTRAELFELGYNQLMQYHTWASDTINDADASVQLITIPVRDNK